MSLCGDEGDSTYTAKVVTTSSGLSLTLLSKSSPKRSVSPTNSHLTFDRFTEPDFRLWHIYASKSHLLSFFTIYLSHDPCLGKVIERVTNIGNHGEGLKEFREVEMKPDFQFQAIACCALFFPWWMKCSFAYCTKTI